ncbi:MAG: glycoside hydrolase family 2 [Telmatospirillum sp.]|nr:glycoside hydrolase family 2 [Telmatospirillum sp.]
MTVEDPFAHLHDEDYAAAFSRDWAGAGSLVDPGGRPVQSLDGEWEMTLDPFDEGLRQRWYALDEAHPENWTVPRDYDPGGADIVPVPSCWNLLRPELKYYEGAVWYVRSFDAAPAPGMRQLLQFGAANYAARVFLNGRFLGAHRGGSTPFTLDATHALVAGKNRLMVHVENRRRDDRVPMSHFDWFNYGGLHRGVGLMQVPALHIRSFAIHLAADRDDAVEVRVALSASVDAGARLRIPELGLDLAVAIVDGVGTARCAAPVALWSPERPRLYDVEIACGRDRVRERIGFRRIATRGTEILLNGTPVRLKGACVHEDDVARGRCTDAADIARRLADIKALGGNFLRLSHYPHDPLVARMADEAGVLLWAEIPVYWAIDFANPDTYADAENQLLELVARDRNRASAILWGVGNENADTDARYRFMAALADAAKRADPTRLVSAACLVNREKFRIEDRLAAKLDVIGLNEYFGWYEPDPNDLLRLLANSDPGKPLLISETGADAVAGLHGAETLLFGEERQAAFYRNQLDILRQFPYVQGMAVWLLYDFRSERRQTRFQRGWNRKGLVAEDKTTRKAAFAALRAAWANW